MFKINRSYLLRRIFSTLMPSLLPFSAIIWIGRYISVYIVLCPIALRKLKDNGALLFAQVL